MSILKKTWLKDLQATDGLEPDQNLKCNYPEGKNSKQFGEIRVTKVPKPRKKRGIGDTTDEEKVCSSFQIRPDEWWEPAVWWLETPNGLIWDSPSLAWRTRLR